MSPRNRAFLRWAFIIVFLILAPVIILSTAGYRFNFGKRSLERTGVIIVSSTPSGASVTLNGRLADTTPARLTRTFAGDYRVRVEKAGYRAWEKDVTVEEGQTIFLNGITLFRDALPVLERTQPHVTASAFSPDGRYGATVADAHGIAELHVYDFRTGIDLVPYRSASGTDSAYGLAWSDGAPGFTVAQRGSAPVTYLWTPEEPNVVAKTNGDALETSVSGSGSLRASARGGRVRLVDPATDETLFDADGNGAAWSSDGTRLLYWNDLEIHVFDVQARRDDLITRVSGRIEKAAWHANDSLILYAADGAFVAIESGQDSSRTSAQLAAMQSVTDFAVTKAGDAWIVGTLGHQEGVFSLQLK